jgi:hypothetical protein
VRIKRKIYEDKMKDIYKELLDTKDIKGYTQEYLARKKISLHIINRYPVISMLFSCQRYLFISLKLIRLLIRIKGYLGIWKDMEGYLRISFWGELPDALPAKVAGAQRLSSRAEQRPVAAAAAGCRTEAAGPGLRVAANSD